MSFTIAEVSNDLTRMENTIDHVKELSQSVGGFGDTPQLREDIQSDVKTISDLSKTIKSNIEYLRQQNVPGLEEQERRFDKIREQMQVKLREVIEKLRNNDLPSHDQYSYESTSQPLLDQGLLDQQSDQLDELESEINEILQTMKEVKALFCQTLEEIQKQQHILFKVDKTIQRAHDDAVDGNQQLDTAQQHQKGSTKVLCCLLIFFLVVAVGVSLFLALWFTKHKKSGSSGGGDDSGNSTTNGTDGLFFI